MTATSGRTHSLANLLVRIALGVVIFGLGIGTLAALVATRPTPPQSPRSETARAVRTLTLRPVQVTRRWEGFGAARAIVAADISAEISGTVAERPDAIEPGFPIREGDLIVAIEGAEFEARAERTRQGIAAIEAERLSLDVDEQVWEVTLGLARESVALLKDELERLRAAVAASGATVVEVDRLRREITRAEREAETIRQQFEQVPSRRAALEARLGVERAALAMADIDIARSRIASPIDGILQEISVKRGERLSPGAPVARVVNLRRMEAPVRVPVSALADIGPGSPATLSTTGPMAHSWEGVVARIAPEADVQTRSATVYVEIEQEPDVSPSDALTPGRFVMARISSRAPIAALAIPRSAINGDRVLIVDGVGRAASRRVIVAFHVDSQFPALLPDERQWAIVESGLEAGDQLVISNLDELRPGMMIHKSGADEPMTAAAPVTSAAGAAP